MTKGFREFIVDAYAAWNRGDLEGFVAFAAPDIVIRPSGAFPDLPAEYRGHTGVRDFWRDVRSPWRELLVHVEEVEEHDDLAFVTFRFRASGRDGMAVNARFFQVGKIGEGAARRIEAFIDEDKARARLKMWSGTTGT